jgi:protein O-mannosyl-transferase
MALRAKRKFRVKSAAARSLARDFSPEVAAVDPTPTRKQALLLVVPLVALTLALYLRVAWHPFINFDDGPYVFENSHVRSGLNWQTVRWSFTSFDAANWHPLTWLSHTLDYQLYGLHAGGHHLTSLLLHVTNVVLLYLLLLRVTGAKWRSFLVAALFAVHPLNVESVAWVAERKNLLCTFFFLLALGAYGWYSRKPGVWRYLIVAALFGLGLASKPMVITFPFVLLLLDFWPLGRIEGWSSPPINFRVHQTRFSQLMLEKLPLLALSLASGVITFVAQRNGGAFSGPEAGWTIGWRIQNALHSYAMYLCKLFFPADLALLYPGAMLHWWEVAAAVLLLLGAACVIWRFHAGRPYLVTGGLWFLGTLVPVIGIVQVGSQAMADRYTYIPMIGICVAVVWGFSEAADAQSIGVLWRRAASVLVLGAMALVTWRQVGYWTSSLDLWTHALKVTRGNSMSEVNMGTSLLNLGREDEAYMHFQRALVSKPDDHLALLYSGIYLEKHGHYQESIEKLEGALRAKPRETWEIVAASRGLGLAYTELGDRARARANFGRAVQTEPGDLADLQQLGLLEMQDAIDGVKRSVAAHPTPRGYLQLGQLLQENGTLPDAQTAYEQALHLDPHLTEAQQALRILKGRQQQ